MKINRILLVVICGLLQVGGAVCAQAVLEKDTLVSYQKKCSPSISPSIFKDNRRHRTFLVKVNDWAGFAQNLHAKNLENHVREEYPEHQSILMELTGEQLCRIILSLTEVVFVDLREKAPTEDQAQQNHDPGVNGINRIHTRYPGLTGQNLAASIKEYRFDTTDIDLGGRFVFSGEEAALGSNHATDMATLLGGAGNSFYTGRGVARQCRLLSSSFLRLFPDEDGYFRAFNVSVQNHSYGLEIENYYGAEAEAYDAQVYKVANLVHVFSSGNRGDQTSETGNYAGVPGFANLSGTFKMAKNVLTVGAIDSFLNVMPLSSRGPAFDGRLKPELVAFGNDGSSGAAAITSGLVLLLQQVYLGQTGRLPSSVLVRAILLNSADDIQPQGPDFRSGFGNVNMQRSIRNMEEKHFYEDTIIKDETLQFILEVPKGVTNLKIMLAWNDPAGLVNTPKALVNDLDLRAVHTLSGNTWLPWVLSVFPDADSLSRPAFRAADHLNNQEQITIDNPQEGSYTIEIKGFSLQKDTQSFVLTYQWDTLNHFDWVFPIKGDHVMAGGTQLIRWESNDPAPAVLSYKIIGHSHWTPVAENLDMRLPYTRWQAPDTFALAQLRFDIGSRVILSDTFTISRPLDLQVRVDCETELLLTWQSSRPAPDYRLFSLQNHRLSPILVTADTFAFLEKASSPSSYYAVEPIIKENYPGIRSPALYLVFQQANCYINAFSADLDGNRAVLKLDLGDLTRVEGLIFEKRIDGRFVPIATLPAGQSLLFQHEDPDLQEGVNVYRAQVILTGGQRLISQEAVVFYLGNRNYFLYPNPVGTGEDVIVLSKPVTGATIQVFDALGRFCASYLLLSDRAVLPLPDLPPGLYFYQILEGGKRAAGGKLLVK